MSTCDLSVACILTNRPQGLVLNGYKEHLLHNDFGPDDVRFHFSYVSSNLWGFRRKLLVSED